jgi:hypothetical protein
MADEKKFVSDDGVSTAATATAPEGGTNKKRKADHDKGEKSPETLKAGYIKASKKTEDADVDVDATIAEAPVDDENVEVVEEIVVEESIADIFEGMDLSEEFKGKVTVVFEAAVTEAVKGKVDKITEELNTQLETDLTEAVESKVSEMVENLDAYLDYVVSEWMEENEVAIEAGIKVEMAESLMDGLKELFGEHNIKVDEETYDIVSDLEEEMTSLEEKSNAVVNENIRLSKDIAELRAGVVFEEMTSELNMSQRERLKTLSENLDSSDLDTYTDNLKTIKESFFKETNVSPKEDVVDEEDEVMIEEETVTKPVSDHSSINALVEALNSRKT